VDVDEDREVPGRFVELREVDAHGQAGAGVQDDVLGGDAGGLVGARWEDRLVEALDPPALVDAELHGGIHQHLVCGGLHGGGRRCWLGFGEKTGTLLRCKTSSVNHCRNPWFTQNPVADPARE
jgi:hypothetical protein